MAIAVAQQVVSGASLTAASATTITATITPTAGSKLFVFVRSGNTSATVTCADPTNGSYSSIDVRNLLTNMRGATFYKDGVAGSAVTITATFSAGATDRGMIVLEITGGTTGAPDTFLSASVVGSGTGTDALTTGNMTPTGQPALVLGVYSDFGGVTISAGTGFTGGTVRWNASGDSTLPEWLRITSTTALAATWTPSGSTNGIMMGAIFREASTGITGTGSAAAAPFAASGSGAETFTGTGSSALKSFAASGTGAETFTGTGTAAARPFGASGTGAETFTGTGSAALKSFGASGAGTVLPVPVAGLKLWLRADAGITLSGSNVTAWADQSGNGNDVSSVGTTPFVASAIGGKPGLTIGTNRMVNTTQSPLSAGSARTIFIVAKASTAGGGNILCLRSNTPNAVVTWPGTTLGGIIYADWIDGTRNVSISPLPTTNGVPIVFELGSGGTGAFATCAVNGAVASLSQSVASLSDSGPAGFAVGDVTGAVAPGSFPPNVDISEVLVYDTVLSSSDATLVRNYLATKYGISVGITGTGSAAMSPFAASGAGAETFSGSGSAAAKSFAAAGSGTETFTGTGSAALSPFGASGAGVTGGAAGSGSAALKSFGASGSGTVTFNFTGTGSAALKSFGASGSGFTGAPEPPLTPPLTTVVDPVVLATWVDSVVLTAPVDPVRLSLGERLKTRKTTDTYPITNTLVNNGVPVPLAGYTVTINIVSQDRTTVKRANGACTIIDAPNGRVSYQVVAGDVDTAGSYLVEWKAVSGTGVPYHFPQDGYEPLEIQPSLG